MAQTLLPLETFREEIGFHPFFFWQLASPPDNPIIPLDSGCNALVRERAWQFNDGAGRAEIRNAIEEAEKRLKNYLTFSPAPHWVVDETLDVGCFEYGTPTLLSLKEGRLKQIGQMSWELVQSIPVVLSDLDLDGLPDTFTATVPMPAGVALTDLALFFATSDRMQGLDKDWQIRPVTFEQSGANLVVTCRSWLLVKPVLYEGAWYRVGYPGPAQVGRDSSGALDPINTVNYVTSVALYKRVVTNPNVATLIYDNGSGTTTNYTLTALICNAETGLVKLNTECLTLPEDCYCGGWGGGGNRPVRRIKISYEAGEELEEWQTIIARLAAAELMRKICSCDAANQEMMQWQMDAADPDSKFKPPTEEISSPLGNKRGHIYAWNRIKALRLLRGVAI
jgi:hypothetical protein